MSGYSKTRTSVPQWLYCIATLYLNVLIKTDEAIGMKNSGKSASKP